jgi:opacity protein-like surface antigen
MKRSCIRQLLVIVFVAAVFATAAFAAYEFYVLQLAQKDGQPIDWAAAEKSVRSVAGVANVRVDRSKRNLIITCSDQCTSSLKSGVEGKLKGSGLTLKQIGSGPGDGTAFPKIEIRPQEQPR